MEAAAASKVKARIADRLLFRHWSAYTEGKRTHVFVISTGTGQARDLTPGDYNAPPFSLGGATDYAFSPDSSEVVFARNTDKDEARSTNGDLFIVPVAGGEKIRRMIARRNTRPIVAISHIALSRKRALKQTAGG
jgi:hypothetical protein